MEINSTVFYRPGAIPVTQPITERPKVTESSDAYQHPPAQSGILKMTHQEAAPMRLAYILVRVWQGPIHLFDSELD